jgi:hypothetical protein
MANFVVAESLLRTGRPARRWTPPTNHEIDDQAWLVL